MKRAVSVVLLFLMILCPLTSCSSDDPVVLFFAVNSPAGSFDPQIVSDNTAAVVVRNCFEGLLRQDENGNIVNGVAKSYEVSPDGLKYTFYLREDAVWHLTSNAQKQLKGKIPDDFNLSVTAFDFQFALRRAVDPATGAYMSYMLYNIENAPEILNGTKEPSSLGVKATDRYTLEITLSQPQSNFPEVLTYPICMPCNETFFNACAGRYGTLIAFALSNGPFYLSRFDDASYRINKAPDYVGESVSSADYVWLYVVNDEEKLLEVLETDDYSGAVITEHTYDKLEKSKHMTITESENAVAGFVMNVKDSVLSEENMRRALAAATDIEKIAANQGKKAASGLVPSSAVYESIVTHPEAYSEIKAAEYLKTGLEKLEVTSVDISVVCENIYEDTMRRLLQEWQRILGINVNFSVRAVSSDELQSIIKSGNYQIAFYSYCAETESAYEYFGRYTSSSPYNVTGFDGFGMEEIIANMYSGGENKLETVYSSIESKLSTASIIIPVWTESSYFVCTKDVRGAMYFSGRDKLYFHKATNE